MIYLTLEVLETHTDSEGNTFATVRIPDELERGLGLRQPEVPGLSVYLGGGEWAEPVDTARTGEHNQIVYGGGRPPYEEAILSESVGWSIPPKSDWNKPTWE